MAAFDTYVIVDWSAANVPKTGKDSIWVCRCGRDGETVENPGTRAAARELLAEMLAAAVTRDERVVLGFDFPFGYPQGFGAALGLSGAPWRAVWDEIARLIEDNPKNCSNRFDVGAELNRRISGECFPFWGCPAGHDYDYLGPKRPQMRHSDGLAEKRLIDVWMVGAQPCWKLAYTGSVGSQALTGIPVVRSLRDDPRWADRARVWPFETGLGLPADARIVFAEVWPSWWRGWRDAKYPGEVNDSAQVRYVARLFAEEDTVGVFASKFAGDPFLTETQRRNVEAEEAWTLGVTEPRTRKLPGAAT
jgi:hypothetical protein